MYNRAAMKWSSPTLLTLLLFILAGCTTLAMDTSLEESALPATASQIPTSSPALTAQPTLSLPVLEITSTTSTTFTQTTQPSVVLPPTATPLPLLATDEWQTLPVIPEVSSKVQEIYARGQELGNNPIAFSKIGDCGSTPAWFLGDFDRGPRFYSLGQHTELEEVIQAFQGSFERTSLAAKSGFNASSVFTLIWADRSLCQANETPLACEYRIHRPSVAFITLGSNDVYHMDTFEKQMRAIIEFSIEKGVVPVLSTKADNLEGDGSLNLTIAQLAREYGVPLWNYWLAVQPLPDQGLQDDQVHLTWGPNQFDDPRAMKSAWAMRNLTALQTLDIVWRSMINLP